MVKSSKGKEVASDPPPPQIIDLVSSDEEVEVVEVVHDPDPIRWALPADGEPVVRQREGGRRCFTEEQLVQMNNLGHRVKWNLYDYRPDRTFLTGLCSDIGITRNQFRGWVHRRIKEGVTNKGCSSGSGSGVSGGSPNDEGGPSSAA